ncbi:MAG TPA: hypothetical protein VFM81_10265 [Actinomycetota bacterium]|nr:hypothetical protein [Actinomycetota bacterium]
MRSFTRVLALLLAVGVAACAPASESGSAQGLGRGGSKGALRPAGVLAVASSNEPARGTIAPPPIPTRIREDEPYRGLGTWIDIYDHEVWKHPTRSVRSMAAHGIRTIYLQTSNYNRNQPFVHREGVEAILDAAQVEGLGVVAWYLPGFADVSTDLRRTMRTIRKRTSAGNAFDSFALDIESPEVRRPSVRTRRLLRLSEAIRREAGPGYPLGAIVASPDRLVRTDPHFWPGFPWRRLADLYDVMLPMTYYTYRVAGPQETAWYTAQSVQIIRRETAGMNVPIHVVGGISFDATGPETKGFVRTVENEHVIGASYYTFPGITPDQWRALQALR